MSHKLKMPLKAQTDNARKFGRNGPLGIQATPMESLIN